MKANKNSVRQTRQYIIGATGLAIGIISFFFTMAYMQDFILLPIAIIIVSSLTLALISLKK